MLFVYFICLDWKFLFITMVTSINPGDEVRMDHWNDLQTTLKHNFTDNLLTCCLLFECCHNLRKLALPVLANDNKATFLICKCCLFLIDIPKNINK